MIAKPPMAPPEAHVNVHKNATLTPAGRAQMVERVLAREPVSSVAKALGVSLEKGIARTYLWIEELVKESGRRSQAATEA